MERSSLTMRDGARIAARTLAGYLAATIRTGLFCSYNPDSRLTVRWEL
jgi:hypothetical protein